MCSRVISRLTGVTTLVTHVSLWTNRLTGVSRLLARIPLCTDRLTGIFWLITRVPFCIKDEWCYRRGCRCYQTINTYSVWYSLNGLIRLITRVPFKRQADRCDRTISQLHAEYEKQWRHVSMLRYQQSVSMVVFSWFNNLHKDPLNCVPVSMT